MKNITLFFIAVIALAAIVTCVEAVWGVGAV